MTFARPELIPAALLVPLALGLAVWLYGRRRRRIAARFSDAHLLQRLGGDALTRFPRRRLVLVTLAGLCIGLALAGPRWGVRAVEGRPLALNIVIVADISRSMLAEDIAPNRLEQARLFSRRLLRELPGDRFGLVVFAGRSYTLSPLTVDHSAIELYIDALDPNMVSMGGSSLGASLRQATDLLRGAQIERGERVVVVLSDGEVTEELPEVRAATERAQRADVRIMTVGFGTPAGARIEVRDDATGEVRVIRNEYGEVHITQLDEGTLREIAARTGGTYVRADDPGALNRLVAELRRMERGEGEAATRLEPVDRAPILAGLAVLFLMLDTLLAAGLRGAPARRAGAVPVPASTPAPAPATRRRTVAGRAAIVAFLLMGAGLGFGPGDLERGNRLYREGRYEEAVEVYRRVVQSGRTAPEVHYNLGTALLATGSYEEAEQHLRAALQGVDPELRQRSFYNLGNRFLVDARGEQDLQRQGRLLDAAIEAYRRTLRMAPGDVQAKWNLELALQEREQNEQQQSMPSQQDPQEGQDGDQDREQDAEGGGAGGMGGAAPTGQGQDPGADTDQQPMSREEADRILSAIEQDERELTRERLRRGQRSTPVLRDW